MGVEELECLRKSLHEVEHLDHSKHATASNVGPGVGALEPDPLPMWPYRCGGLSSQKLVDSIDHLVVFIIVWIQLL